MVMITLSSPAFLWSHKIHLHPNPMVKPSLSARRLHRRLYFNNFKARPILNPNFDINSFNSTRFLACSPATCSDSHDAVPSRDSVHIFVRGRALQFILWVAEGVYVFWLFILPYAPGDPVWAISSNTINSLIGLSLNFFFILPLMNTVGIHLIDSPVLHPVSEGLFNFVIGWTFMFAPLLFTDRKRDRYKWSLDLFWALQMLLTNTFLIPYMAIRLNAVDTNHTPAKLTQFGSLMTNGAPFVGLIGGTVCFVSVIWALFGRMDGDFGGLMERWGFWGAYVGSERLAYAFVWDILLYTIFQPCLIGDNLQNVQENRAGVVNVLRFVPVAGLIAYLVCLRHEKE